MNRQIEADKQEVPVAVAGLAAGTPVVDHSLPADLGSSAAAAAAGHMLRPGSSYSGCNLTAGCSHCNW